MRSRRLGSDGPEISVLGFGAWAAGGPWQFGWGPQDDDDSIAAIRQAIEHGVNWVDTAAAYGWGRSEQVVGRALAGIDDVLVFTKCGLVAGPAGEPARDLRPATIRAECEASLRRLCRDHIDVYQFHWPDETGTAVEDSWSTMLDLVAEGKVRWPGVCNLDVDMLDRCERRGHVQSVQSPYSLIRRDVEPAQLPWCRTNRSGFVAYSPMESGLLSGAFSKQRMRSLADGDFRARSSRFVEPHLSEALGLVERLRPVAAELEVTIPELAVAWVVSHPAVTAAIVGARNPDQVDGWIGAATLDIGTAFRDDLTRLVAAPAETEG
jgi:aryl-alcohol dehydrogenase-like predicted oxidoreductase